MSASLATSVPAAPFVNGPLETSWLGLSFDLSAPTGVRLSATSPRDLRFCLLTRILLNNRPLALDCTTADVVSGARVSTLASVLSRCLSAHLRIQIINGSGEVSVPVAVEAVSTGLTVRALAHPSIWSGESSITVCSLTLAGRPLPCPDLPATLRTTFSHVPAPAGAVWRAADAGDVPALEAALAAGDSTEEADWVCAAYSLECRRSNLCPLPRPPFRA